MASSKSFMVALCMVLAVSSAYAARDLKQTTTTATTKKLDLSQGVGFSWGYNLGWALGLLGFNTANAQTNGYTWGKGVQSVNTVTPTSNAGLGAGVGAAAGGGLSWNLFGKKGSIGAQNAIAATAANAANTESGATTNGQTTTAANASAASGTGTGKAIDLAAESTLIKNLVSAIQKKTTSG